MIAFTIDTIVGGVGKAAGFLDSLEGLPLLLSVTALVEVRMISSESAIEGGAGANTA